MSDKANGHISCISLLLSRLPNLHGPFEKHCLSNLGNLESNLKKYFIMHFILENWSDLVYIGVWKECFIIVCLFWRVYVECPFIFASQI